MRPLKAMRPAPVRSDERANVPTVSVRLQRLACARLSLAVGARQLRPRRRPGAKRVNAICIFAAAESVKWKLVPTGIFLAEIAVFFRPTRKRLFVMLAELSTGGRGFAVLIAGDGTIVRVAAVLVPLPITSALVSVTW
jgi:hypothetical protein